MGEGVFLNSDAICGIAGLTINVFGQICVNGGVGSIIINTSTSTVIPVIKVSSSIRIGHGQT